MPEISFGPIKIKMSRDVMSLAKSMYGDDVVEIVNKAVFEKHKLDADSHFTNSKFRTWVYEAIIDEAKARKLPWRNLEM